MNDQETSSFTLFFNRLPGEWWITGETLIHWVKHRELNVYRNTLSIELTCDKGTLENYCCNRNVSVFTDDYGMIVLGFGYTSVYVRCCKKLNNLIVASPQEKERLRRRNDLRDNGLWTVNIDPLKPYTIQIPFRFGTILDNYKPLWWVGDDKSDFTATGKPLWFIPEMKQSGYELLQAMFDCGERAGIRKHMWLSFGNLLGYVTTGDFLKHDNDLDVCINTDATTPEKCNKYVEEVRKPMTINGKHYPHGLGEKMFRHANKRDDNGCPIWISIGHRSVTREHGVKSCNWFMFEHSNYSWHSKGDMWIQPGKFNEIQYSRQDKAICLGQPSGDISLMTEVDFKGVAVNAPTNAGTVLDWYYPGFCSLGQGGSSMRRRILVVPDWNKSGTWRMS